MAPQRETIQVGPWPGGLNEVLPASDINDDQLALAAGVELNNDGSLNPRRAWQYTWSTSASGGANWLYNASGLRTVSILGTIRHGDDEYVFIAARESAQCTIWYTNIPDDAATWKKLTTLAGTGDWPANIVRYNDVIYINRSENAADTGSGGWSFPSSSIGSTGITLTTVANIPKGNQMFLFKDRMWVVHGGNNVVLYSKATDPTIWAAPDGGFFYVSRGDGEALYDVIVGNNQLYIFKERKSFRFYYSSDPGVDGTLLLINDTIGGYAVWNKDRIFLVSYSGVFQVINDQFYNLSKDKINDRNIQVLDRPCVIQDHLYFQWTGEFFTKYCYSMNINLGAFTSLQSGDAPSPLLSPLQGAGFYKWARFSNDTGVGAGNGWLCQWSETGKELFFVADAQYYVVDLAKDQANYFSAPQIRTKIFALGDGFEWNKIRRVYFDGLLLPFWTVNNNAGIWWELWLPNTENHFETFNSSPRMLPSHFKLNSTLLNSGKQSDNYQQGFQYFGTGLHRAARAQFVLNHQAINGVTVNSALGNDTDDFGYCRINRFIIEVVRNTRRTL